MSDEEIEKSKDRIKILLKDDCNCPECIKNKKAYEALLQYIAQLEQENNKQNKIIDEIKNKVHYIKCENCGVEMRVKRSNVKYCAKCSQKLWYKNLSEEKKAQRREKAKISMRKMRVKRRELQENAK